MMTTGEVNIIIGTHRQKKYSHCFFFVAAAAFGDLLDFVMLLPFFCGGVVSLHYQKDPKIWCHCGSRSKTSKDPKIQK
jgi:hypothetical protein